jgi:hypothetical protein
MRRIPLKMRKVRNTQRHPLTGSSIVAALIATSAITDAHDDTLPGQDVQISHPP